MSLPFRLVTGAWGYFLWSNQFVYISADGSEANPRVKYAYDSKSSLKLESVIDGTNVKIYINGVLLQEVVLKGEGADSTTDNYVGMWCHRLMSTLGQNFQVSASM